MELLIVNPDPRYSRAKLIEPTTLGYIHLAAEVSPGPILPQRLPFIPEKREVSGLTATLKKIAHGLEQLEALEKATVFEAVVIAPTDRFSSYLKERGDSVHFARFDEVVLIETISPEAADEVQSSPVYGALVNTLSSKARHMHVIAGSDRGTFNDVEH